MFNNKATHVAKPAPHKPSRRWSASALSLEDLRVYLLYSTWGNWEEQGGGNGLRAQVNDLQRTPSNGNKKARVRPKTD